MPRKGPNWLRQPSEAKKRHEFGKREEKRALRKMNAKQTPRSGAGRIKGDGRLTIPKQIIYAKPATFVLHIEHKATKQTGFRISKRLIEKLRKEAGWDRHPIFVVSIVGQGGKAERWVALPVESFTQITDIQV